jgi:predicted phosphate transport protein (TIGR00153 family)
MFRLIPRDEKFFEMFVEAAHNIQAAARALVQMFKAFEITEEQWKPIEDLEHEGDKITHRILRRLNRTFITPIDNEDIHHLTTALDDVVDLIEAVAARMAMYKVKQATPYARRLADLIALCGDQIVRAVENMPRLEHIQEHCVEINRLENDADNVSREAIADLFEKGAPPIEIIKWKEIYETLETATDRCEDVANIVEQIALKNA